MRIPRVHSLTLDYCRAFGLELRPFIMECAQAPLYLAGRRWTYGDVNADVFQLPFDFGSNERGRGYDDLWSAATQDIRDLFARDPAAADELSRGEH